MRHLKFQYISILANLVRTDNETKSVKAIYNHTNPFTVFLTDH